MYKLPAFTRRAWEKYPIYFTDEAHDNLDEDPNDPRNTKTLAEELAAYEAKERAGEASQNGISLHPEKRVKAPIGKGFLRRANAAKVAADSRMQENAGQKKTNSGIQQNGSPQDAGMQVGKSVSPFASAPGASSAGSRLAGRVVDPH